MFSAVLDSTITALAIPIWIFIGIRTAKLMLDSAAFYRSAR